MQLRATSDVLCMADGADKLGWASGERRYGAVTCGCEHGACEGVGMCVRACERSVARMVKAARTHTHKPRIALAARMPSIRNSESQADVV